MRSRRSTLVFSRLLLPRPLATEQVEALLRRLAADRAAPLLAFEARATASGTTFWVGTPSEHLVWTRRTIQDLIAGASFLNDDRGALVEPETARRLRIRPTSLALNTESPEASSLAVLSALDARLFDGETLVLQILLGPRRGGRHLRGDLPDPAQPWWQLLSEGSRPAPQLVRKQAEARSADLGFGATIRLGSAAKTADRRRRLIIGLLGALATAQSPGTYIDLRPDRVHHLLTAAPSWRWPLRLAVAELVGLLGWPLGNLDAEFPGLPAAHPKLLRPSPAVTQTERVFARSAAPGDDRTVGIAAADALFNGVWLGPTGSGKSVALLHLIRADIEAGRSVLVVEPKRQLIDDIIDRAVSQDRIDDVVLIDSSLPSTAGFNPLDVGNRDPDVVVDSLLAVFAAVFHDGWGPRTQDILHSALLTLARAGQRPSTDPFTLLDVPRLLTDAGFRRSVIGTASEDIALQQFWAGFQSMTPGAQTQAIAAPMNKLRQYLLRPALRRVLGQPSPRFKLRDVFRQHKIVLVPLNEGLIGPITAQLLGSLVVAETWQATLERASEQRPAAQPGSVYVDEVQQYLNLPTSIADALSQTRSYGVGWHLAHQHRGQLSPEVRAAIDSNARTKVVFRPSDPDDARVMARHAPGLDAIDFQSLPAFHAYADITVGGVPSGWSTIRTLPPPELTGVGDAVRRATARNYGISTNAGTPTVEVPPISTSDVVGRKRRSDS